MNDYFLEHSVIHATQSGFRPQHTTQYVCFGMVEQWKKALDEDQLVGSIMLDLSKAFDTVDHSILLKKLSKYGVVGNELMWFQDYLYDQKLRVRFGNVLSSWSSVLRGVPQESNLGPLLFILYVNDLPCVVKSSKVMQYTDDTTLLLVSGNIGELNEGLTLGVEEVAKWAKRNKLKLNVKKQMLVLSSKRRRSELDGLDVRLDGQLPRSSKVKCLGVMIDEELSWHKHIDHIRRICFLAPSTLRRYKDVMPAGMCRRFFMALIISHIGYCSLLWMDCAKSLRDKVERIQN